MGTMKPDFPEKKEAVSHSSRAEQEDKPRAWEPDDAVLNEPLAYVISAPDALAKVGVLLTKVAEARPDLAPAMERFSAEVATLTESMMAPREVKPRVQHTSNQEVLEPGQETETISPGDKVSVATESGEEEGQVFDQNEDGTFEVNTQSGLMLSKVPASSIKRLDSNESTTLALPAGVKGKLERIVLKAARRFGVKETAKLLGELKVATKSKEVPQEHKPRVEAAVKMFKAGKLNLKSLDMYHPVVQSTVHALLKDKTSLGIQASIFTKLDTPLEIGGGYTAQGKGKEDTLKTVVIKDKNGKEISEYPDAFGDDSVAVIKLLRQIEDIKEEDDKKAPDLDIDNKKSDKKLSALPETKEEKSSKRKKEEKKEDSKDEDKETPELAASKKFFESRLAMAREIVAERVRKRYVVAEQDDIDTLLYSGLSLEASVNGALTQAVERDLFRVLSLPDAELPLIRASLSGLKVKATKVDDTVSINGGLPFLGGIALRVQASAPGKASVDIGTAMSAGFGRR